MFNSTSYKHIQYFWLLQILFWLGLSLITFVTLTLWYGQVGWLHIGHTVLQGVLGLALSMPLHLTFDHFWNWSLWLRIGISILVVAAIACLWTVSRMYTFIWITGQQGLWADFGGWYFGALYVFLCWTSLYYGIRYFQLLQSAHGLMIAAQTATGEEQLKRSHAESKAKEAQLKMLQYQLNPHFLFNTLNAINSLIRAKQADKAQRMVVQLSHFLRYSLDNDPQQKISLEREIDALLLYLEIEKTRFGNRLKLEFDISEEAKSALIPSLLLQPIIENSMKYAIAKSEHGGTICLQSGVYDDRLELQLSDTGSGKKLQSSKIKSADGRGIGLRNTIERLKTFYDGDFDFDLATSSSGGLSTTIRIPYESLQHNKGDMLQREAVG